jgi:hypothetical protein
MVTAAVGGGWTAAAGAGLRDCAQQRCAGLMYFCYEEEFALVQTGCGLTSHKDDSGQLNT